MLPVWHNISKEALARYSPILSDRLAANTQDGIPAVAAQIIDLVFYRAADTPSGFFPNLTHRFVQLIRNASPADVRDFLIQHPQIIVQALGKAQRLLMTLYPGLLGQQVPAIIVNFESEPGYSVKEDRTIYLMFISPDTRLLEEESLEFKSVGNVHGIPLLESARRILLEQQKWEDAFVITGRRHELTDADRVRMQDFNEANEYSARRSLRVRTYDWLIDACVELDKKF